MRLGEAKPNSNRLWPLPRAHYAALNPILVCRFTSSSSMAASITFRSTGSPQEDGHGPAFERLNERQLGGAGGFPGLGGDVAIDQAGVSAGFG